MINHISTLQLKHLTSSELAAGFPAYIFDVLFGV